MAQRKSTKGQTTIYKTYTYFTNLVTRTPLKEQDSKNLMENCGVIPQDWFNENKQPEDNTIENNERVNENQNTPAARVT
jgi:hypothetical protein